MKPKYVSLPRIAAPYPKSPDVEPYPLTQFHVPEEESVAVNTSFDPVLLRPYAPKTAVL